MSIKDGIKQNDNKILSFLMIGQSNMAGRGEFADVRPIRNPKCFMLRMGRWQQMSEPINPDRTIFDNTFHSGVSLAASFADELSKHFDINVGLIPCADGGTGIKEWQPGEILYDHAVMMTKLAMRTSTFGGILWHQGESDCREYNEAEYRRMFLNLFTNLRRDLNAEKLPLVIGELSDKISDKWQLDGIDKMNALLHKLSEEIPLCTVATAENLTLKPDGIHFDAVSSREFGIRYFEKYKTVCGF